MRKLKALAKVGAPRRRWKRILVVFCVAVALFGLAILADRQPTYEGRTVEAWLVHFLYPERDLNFSQTDARTALRAMGRAAVPYEIKVLGQHDSLWRHRLRGILEKAPDFLAGMLPRQDHPDLLRDAAMLALMDNPHTVEFASQIFRLLEDSDESVRLDAAKVVLHIAESLDRSAIPALGRALNDPDPSMRRLVASALGRMGTKAQEAVPRLERALEDPDLSVRLAVESAIMRIRETSFANR